jgi:hypothetical protein
MKIIALFVQALLWLSVAFSPTLLGIFVGVILKFNLTGQLSDLALPVFSVVGFALGALWAERIRKTVGLSTFLGRLNGHRDIDGLPK